MIGPSSKISKLLLFTLVLLIIFYVIVDIKLYMRLKDYAIERNFNANISGLTDHYEGSKKIINESKSTRAAATLVPVKEAKSYELTTWLSCDINPLCHLTVKALLLDHTNHYLFAPVVAALDDLIGLSKSGHITPNMISFSHVGVACAAGKLISSNNLGYRRLGVVLFEIRTLLDDLDGHVARKHKKIKGERSEVGTSGYFVDGICDGLGCIALVLGMFYFLKNNPPRRGYSLLPTIESKGSPPANTNKIKPTMKKVVKKVIAYTGQLILSSIAWNRYISVYQDMLESDNVSTDEFIRQNIVFKSNWMLFVAWMWRIVNVHSLLHWVLLAIFCDKLWEFLKIIQYLGYLILLVVILITEIHVKEASNFIFQSLSKNTPL